MASFNVHLSVGLIASGIAATSMLVAGLATEKEFILYFMLGSLGSLLPDLDADNSKPVQFSFSLVSIALAFVTMFYFARHSFSVVELVLVWFVSYLTFRWLVFAVFTRLTTHRGVFHSVPAAFFFGFVVATLTHRLFMFDPLQAWMSGLFVSFGFLVHLILDEMYSVNLFGVRARKSLGTAFKFYSKNSYIATLSLYLATFLVFLTTPSITPLIQVATDEVTYQKIRQRVLPSGPWFNLQESPAPSSVR